MITIIKCYDGFIVSGHANYAEKGKDIVCAAVSTLTETFIDSWGKLTDEKIKVHKEAGDVRIEYEKERSDVAETLIRSFLIGVRGVRDAYPDHVQLDETS